MIPHRNIPGMLGFSAETAADLSGQPVGRVMDDVESGRLPVRWAGKAFIILRQDLVEWIEGLQQYEVAAATADKDELIFLLQARINELEHQILREDPFLPIGVIKRHAKCVAPSAIKPPKPKHLYFMRCEGYVKIGVSQHPETRLKQIRSGGSQIPVGIDYRTTALLHVAQEAGDKERTLHKKFAHLRHTGEWFTEAPELTEYIESLTKELTA